MHYYSLGEIPSKRHTVFRQPNGELYAEELVSTEGFSNVYSNIYHCFPPNIVKEVGERINIAPKIAVEENLKMRSFAGFNVDPIDDYLKARKVMMVNSDLSIGVAAPRKSMTDYFFKNASNDEMIFVHEGTGTLKTIYGQIKFGYGDYLIIPRGTIYQFEFDTEDNRLMIIESNSPIVTPARYRNKFGQLEEHSPFCERDIRKPQNLETNKVRGEHKVMIKKFNYLYPYTYDSHPFDAIGWDGFLFPYAFNISNFEPITGRVHQPPPVHQTFEARNFVICSFVPRLYDYHPDSIPAPYHHSNVDSDEVLYYVDGDFMSRNHVEKGMFTLHPMGIPHGPHPGAAERSIGKKGTEELAVMIDPFYPLQLTEDALKVSDETYYKSWHY